MPHTQQVDKRQVLLDRMLRSGATAPVTLSIPRRDPGESLPASFSQERMWFLDQLVPGSPFYAESAATRVALPIDPEILGRAINAVVERHESLRTRFELVGGRPVQVVLPSLHIPLAFTDLSALPAKRRAVEVDRLVAEQGLQPFDLARGPLMRVSLLKLGPRDYVFVQTIHHIITDAWSMRVFQKELSTCYTAFASGQQPILPELPIQYGDFAVWQRSAIGGAEIDQTLAYWRNQLKDLPEPNLPYDHPRPSVQSYRGAHLDVRVPTNLSAALHAFSRRERATSYISALAVFAVLLGLYSGQDDIVVGTPVAGRSRLELEPLIGLFLNTIVLRVDLSGDPTFRELLDRVRETAINAYANQDVPFDRLVEELRPKRDLSRNPLFQVLFQLFNPLSDGAGAAAGEPEAVPFERGAAILDLSFHLWDAPGGISGRVEYSTELFEAATVESLFRHFVALIGEVIAQPDRPLSNLLVQTSAERREMLRDWQGPEQEFPAAATLPELFGRRAASTPDAVALIEGLRTASYADLDRSSSVLAARLERLGVRRGGRVAICLDRSTPMVSALIATLRLGAAFVPLDPSYPTERLRFILEDSRATVLMTTRAEADRLAPAAAVLLIEDDATHGDPLCGQDTPHPLDAAYVIYTSGSTGRPKGVVATHRSTLNRLAWMWRDFPFEPGEVACQKTDLGFVDSIWEIFGPLLGGVPIVILPSTSTKDPRLLVDMLAEHGVTRLLVVPSLLEMLLESRIELTARLRKLRWCFTSGERLSSGLAQRFRDTLPDARLVNLYGSSEVAGDITFAVLTDDEPTGDVPIGWPIANSRAYVLDRYLRLVPQGVAGDLYVAGPNLARGYLDRPWLTAERFLPDPFGDEPGARMYFTGDRARQMKDGCLEFLGRLDQQVKLRGFRIELGEVEAVLEEHPLVHRAVAAVEEDDAGGRLVAHIVVDAEAPDAYEVRCFAAARLPAHMVPSALLRVDTLPLLPNGKLDRAALGTVKTLINRPSGRLTPRNAAEEALVSIWAELLNLEQVGLTDNFFDLGGHSLLATRLVSRIRDKIGVELPLPDVFLHPTVEEQAEIIEAWLLREIESISDEQARLHLSAAEGNGQ